MRKTYLRRRLIALAAVVLVVVLVVFGVVIGARGGFGGHKEAQQGSTQGGNASRSSKKSGGKAKVDAGAQKKDSNKAQGGVRHCAADDIKLELTADAQSAPVGGSVDFAATIRYVGKTQCVVDASDGSRVLTVTSGSDSIWRSDVCPASPRTLLMTDVKGMNRDEQQMVWNADRTEDQCVDDSQLTRVDPGTYTAQLSLKDHPAVTSDKVSVTLE